MHTALNAKPVTRHASMSVDGLLHFYAASQQFFWFFLICFGCSNILFAAVYCLPGTGIFSQLSKRKQTPPAGVPFFWVFCGGTLPSVLWKNHRCSCIVWLVCRKPLSARWSGMEAWGNKKPRTIHSWKVRGGCTYELEGYFTIMSHEGYGVNFV